MKKSLPILLLLLALAPAQVHALGIRLWSEDTEAAARGSAFTATADNPGAIYYNPAGITQLDGQQFSLSTYMIVYDVDFHGRNGVNGSTVDKLQATAQLYYTFSIKNTPLTLGLGIYEPYGLKSEWRDSGPFRTLATKNSLLYVSVNPVLAWKINNQLSIAAGLRIDPAHVDLQRGILLRHDLFRYTGDATTLGFNAGILWQPAKQHSFGLNYFSETTENFDGRVRINSRTPFLFPSLDQAASLEFRFPQHLVFGYSYRPADDWNFEADIDWTDWNRTGTTRISKASGDVVLPLNWNSGFAYEFGVTKKMTDRVAVSAGYIYAPKNEPNSTFNPAIPDIDFHTFSVGATYETERWRLALTYQLVYGTRDVIDSHSTSLIGENADGHYRWISHAVMLGAGIKF